jgi:hypothetical protein
MAGAPVETTLELWASSLREVKARMRPLFSQKRVRVIAFHSSCHKPFFREVRGDTPGNAASLHKISCAQSPSVAVPSACASFFLFAGNYGLATSTGLSVAARRKARRP